MRDVGLGPVDLVQVNVVGAQAAQRIFHRLQDVPAREAAGRCGPADLGRSALGGQEHSVAAAACRAWPTHALARAVVVELAVSTKLMPASSAAWMMRMASGSGVGPPKFMVPRHSGETRTPVGPSGRYSIGLPSNQQRCTEGTQGSAAGQPFGPSSPPTNASPGPAAACAARPCCASRAAPRRGACGSSRSQGRSPAPGRSGGWSGLGRSSRSPGADG